MPRPKSQIREEQGLSLFANEPMYGAWQQRRGGAKHSQQKGAIIQLQSNQFSKDGDQQSTQSSASFASAGV